MESLSQVKKRCSVTEFPAAFYHAMMEQVPDSLVLLNHETLEVIECNDAFRQLLGYDNVADARRLTGRDFLTFSPTTFREIADTLRFDNKYVQKETNYRHRNQSYVPVHLSLSYFSYQQRSAYCLIAKDDSARRKALTELNRRALVAEKTSNSVIICDINRKVLWVNQGFILMTGFGLEEVVGHEPERFLYGELTDPMAATVIEQRLQNLEPVEGEVYCYHKNGRGYWAFFSITPMYDETGVHLGFSAIGTDVTERKELLASLQHSQQHYRALTEAAPDIIITISPQSEILFINEAVEKILGYPPIDLMGQKLAFLLPDSSEIQALLDNQRAPKDKTERLAGGCTEVTARRADGDTIPMELCVSSFRLKNETYLSGVLRDITERKKAMELLRQREQQAGIKAEISAILASPQVSLQCILENTATTLNQLLDLAMTRIWTLNVETDRLELQANSGMLHAPALEFHNVPIGERKIGQVALNRQRYLSNNALRDVFADHLEWAQSEHLTAFAAYPLLVECRLVGVMALFSRHVLSPNIFEILDGVADLVAQRIERQWLDDALADSYAKLETRVKERTAALEQANVALENEIKERRRIEQELHGAQGFLRQVLSDLPNPVFVKDEAGSFVLVNDAFANLYGKTAEEMVGKTDFDFSHEEEAQLFRADDLKTLASPHTKLIPEEKFTDYQGKVRCFHTAKRAFSLGADQPRYLLGISTDLSDQKALENQLRRAQKLESIGQLAAGIAHEINTPTQYVGDNTRFVSDAFIELEETIKKAHQLLIAARADRISDKEVEQFERELQMDVMPLLTEIPLALQASMEGLHRIAQIVRSMKEFSHPGSSEKKPADLNKAIQSTLTVARNEWKYVADVETNFDENLPVVPCLLGELNQVFLNLIVNAAHAIAEIVGDGSQGKGKITVTTKKIDSHWAEIRVGDTGGGIPETIQHLIFDPFFTTKEIGIGTGQGLAISHLVIVEKHQGQFTFETAPGQGTTFIIRLPLGELDY